LVAVSIIIIAAVVIVAVIVIAVVVVVVVTMLIPFTGRLSLKKRVFSGVVYIE
jgi:hypothetical protein